MVSVLIIVIAVLVLVLVGMFFLFARSTKTHLATIEKTVQDEIARNRDEQSSRAREDRQEVLGTLKSFEGSVEKRLGDSFTLISQRLESVYRGLGEMQSLASSVGDLKKVLTNVKTRGIWGEVQLGMLLEQVLTPSQYQANVVTKKGSNERVEFAVKLPGRAEDDSQPVWLPIDAKFPQEDYQRLIEAQEAANPELAEKQARQLEIRIKGEAKDIKEKYLDPPHTTDYGIMFLPTEGLFAEVLRRPGLKESIERDFRVTIAGPTTLAALLNSIQMGFRTLAIEKRSSQVWQLLGVIKTEFAKFGDILDKTKKKLQEAINTVEDASSKTRNIQKRLKKAEESPSSQKPPLVEDASLADTSD
ncbi:MAG: DNA recombination protein RmuC [Candidatus Omnitrophica bacterium]|nr:DNA recombination protein RmuC [Candidatus Omnitrophota bacterium]